MTKNRIEPQAFESCSPRMSHTRPETQPEEIDFPTRFKPHELSSAEIQYYSNAGQGSIQKTDSQLFLVACKSSRPTYRDNGYN
ncbi:hypothetical protein F9C07_12958 [Aspergillus flavus]|uniref:Uncharacterized protein n=1 Tax=Aspergillus flavus (strain ATCC 200026 / FGSC A1120 / IAM 13836 / NRRL 3357 / JCM 12722 / SRRC 167) TaxID=332952 RepID=A0A7U2R3K0_ASPFN|nr:hypothetical protein F9C07_12958 [Aspergillus flavus]